MPEALGLGVLATLLSPVFVRAQFWTVQSGPCTIANNCLQSPNFPADYGNGERCDVTVISNAWNGYKIVPDATFYTEGCCDHLTINGQQYSSNIGPTDVVPSGTITWSSDPLPNSGTHLSWRLCPVSSGSSASPTPATADSGSSSNGWVIPVVVVGALVPLLVCAAAAFYFRRSLFGKKADVKPKPAALAPATAVRPMAVPMAATIPPAAATTGLEDGEEGPGRVSSSWIRTSRKLVDLPPDEARVPPYWKTKGLSAGVGELMDVSKAEQDAIQQLLDSTFKQITTRDRKSAIPKRLKMVQVQRIENPELWKKYASGRFSIRSKRPHKCTATSVYGGEVLTSSGLPSENKKAIEQRINEVYLFHGTSPHGAMGISKTGFSLRFCGEKTGSMYGNGLYFAECASKSDEYAVDDEDGIYRGLYCLLLCRTILGELLHLTTGGEATHQMIKSAIESEAYDSVLGDRKASVGTYREFIVYQEDQVYPEYLILYKRET